MHTTLFSLLELLLRFDLRHWAIVQNIRKTATGEIQMHLEAGQIVRNTDLIDSLAPSLPEFEIRDQDHLSHDIAAFITQMTEAQLCWLREVRDTFWHETNDRSEASKLFMSAMLDGIPHRVAYIIVRAFMAYAEFTPPKNLHTIAYATYYHVRQ